MKIINVGVIMIDALEEDFIDLHVGTAVKKSCFMRWFALVWMPLLILLGVIAGYLDYIAFNVELHSVLMISAIFIIFLFFIKHNAHYASCKFMKRNEEMSTALKWFIKNNRLTIGETTKANAPFDTFMQGFSSTLRNDNFASVAAGVFPTLGILGTFISIALSMPDFSSQSSAQLEREISLLLGGVGTAFYVSIYGIFLSLWWTFYEKSGMSRFEKNIHKIKENLKHYFWSKEEIEQIHFAKSMDNFERLNSVFSNMGSNDFMANMQTTLDNASVHFINVVKEADKSLSKSEKLYESYDNISLSMQHVVNRLEENNILMRQALDKITYKEDRLEGTEALLSQNIESLNKSLSHISAENVKELYASVVQNIEIMKSESAKVGYAFNRHLEDFDDKYTKKLKTSLELIDSESAKIIEQIAQLRVIDKR